LNLIWNERVKLAANALNTLATATITVGVLAPTAAVLYGLGNLDPSRPFGIFLLSGLVWVSMGGTLHYVAQWLLGKLEQ
jgi:hypothetical protein